MADSASLQAVQEKPAEEGKISDNFFTENIITDNDGESSSTKSSVLLEKTTHTNGAKIIRDNLLYFVVITMCASHFSSVIAGIFGIDISSVAIDRGTLTQIVFAIIGGSLALKIPGK